jgi:hypothetical protein
MMERKIRGATVAVTAAAAAVMVKTTGLKKALSIKLDPRRLTSLDETMLVRTFAFDVGNYKLVYLWAATPLLNSCLVNFNLRRSCKVGLGRM